ncbi:MAG: hypothetical protein FWD02_02885 [Bacteroidales bacterium]|nr:hypothetical protein [Bacteroidales bacterium]
MKYQSKNREERLQMCHQMIKRLEEFIHLKGQTFNELTQELQLSSAYFSAPKRGEGVFGADVVVMILGYYRDMSPDWFLFGSGSKFRGTALEANKVTSISVKKNKLEADLRKSLEKTKKMSSTLQKLQSSTEKSLGEFEKLLSKVK